MIPRSAACIAGLLTLVISGGSWSSCAVAAEPYGEVTRFGGPVKEFATDALSAQDEGKFVLPVGFAVEPENVVSHEKNVVYVLDRTLSDTATGELDYRLQELSSGSHEVLGTATIVEKYTDKANFSDVHPLVGLAVGGKRIYTIVESMVKTEGSTYVPVVSKLVAWSTEPELLSKRLVRAEPSEFPETDSVTGASVVANESAFKVAGSLGEMLYEPAGLAADPTTGDIGIEAQAGVSVPSTPGSTAVQLVHTSGLSKGQLGARWTDGNTIGSDGEWDGNGVFAGASEDEFGVDQYTKEEQAPSLSAVNVRGGTATPIAPATSRNKDEVASVVDEAPLSGEQRVGESAFNEVHAAGTPVVELQGGTIYAGIFAQPASGGPTIDAQGNIAPWEFEENGATIEPEDFWIEGSNSTAALGNLGIRLFEADGKVLDTIGGGAPNAGTPTAGSQLGSCNIDFRRASLATGAEGVIFVLTQPRAEGKDSPYEFDDEVIEFAPGGHYRCPTYAEGSVEAKQTDAEPWTELQKGSEPAPSVNVDEGVPISFSAESLDHGRRNLSWKFTPYDFNWSLAYEWTPFAFEWNLEGATSGGPGDDGYTIVNELVSSNRYKWPTPEVSEYVYSKAGIYHASVRVYGAYGTKVYPFIVHVLGSTPPEAGFTAPALITAGVPVTFDGAAESKPTRGTEVEYYEWSFGGAGESPTTTNEGTIEHTFAQAGKYEVTLVIHDKAGAVLASKPVEHEVSVAAAQTTTTTSSATTSTSSTTTSTSARVTTSTTTKTTTTAAKTATKKAPSKKELLVRALKACHKDKSKKKRVSCERQAQKKYGSKPKPKKKTKK